MKLRLIIISVSLLGLFSSCKKDDSTPTPAVANVVFKFRFDSTQVRLNGFGNPTTMASGHAGQSPRFNKMSAHYVELAQNDYTALGAGAVLYKAPETTTGGANAIDFSKATLAGNNEVFLSVPVTSFAAGSYKWLRVSLAYQNYNVYVDGYVPTIGAITIDATVASFIGFNTYISNFKLKDSTVTVNANKLQGYWATEGQYHSALYGDFGTVQTGQAAGTTVPNPLFATSPIPSGSCVVTGQFATPLVITGTETSDINVTVSLSTNKSFEWIDVNGDGKFEPGLTPTAETVVDMGIRGLIPSFSR